MGETGAGGLAVGGQLLGVRLGLGGGRLMGVELMGWGAGEDEGGVGWSRCEGVIGLL